MKFRTQLQLFFQDFQEYVQESISYFKVIESDLGFSLNNPEDQNKVAVCSYRIREDIIGKSKTLDSGIFERVLRGKISLNFFSLVREIIPITETRTKIRYSSKEVMDQMISLFYLFLNTRSNEYDFLFIWGGEEFKEIPAGITKEYLSETKRMVGDLTIDYKEVIDYTTKPEGQEIEEIEIDIAEVH